MKTTNAVIIALATIGASTCLLTAQDSNPGPRGQKSDNQQSESAGGGGFHLVPPHAEEKLNLSAEQITQLKALEEEVKAKLENILTAQQMNQLEKMGPPPPPQNGAGGGGRH